MVALAYHTPDGLGSANADLIASAPDLYETLQRIAAATPNSTNSATAAEMASWTRAVAEAAIARVEGQS